MLLSLVFLLGVGVQLKRHFFRFECYCDFEGHQPVVIRSSIVGFLFCAVSMDSKRECNISIFHSPKLV